MSNKAHIQAQNEMMVRIKEVWDRAEHMYGIPPIEDAIIKFVSKGYSAGKAGKKNGRPFLQLSTEAFILDVDEMMDDTISHEIAHIVCSYDRTQGSNHDRGWLRVHKQLGGMYPKWNGRRTHSLNLTPGKTMNRYEYVLEDLSTVTVSAKRHGMIQRGKMYTCRNMPLNASNVYRMVGESSIKPQPAKRPKRTGISKAIQVQQICHELRHSKSSEVIQTIMERCDMTKAGASTYYYKYR